MLPDLPRRERWRSRLLFAGGLTLLCGLMWWPLGCYGRPTDWQAFRYGASLPAILARSSPVMAREGQWLVGAGLALLLLGLLIPRAAKLDPGMSRPELHPKSGRPRA